MKPTESQTVKFMKDSVSHLWSSSLHQWLDDSWCVVGKYQRLCVTTNQLKQFCYTRLLPLRCQLRSTACQSS